MRGAPCSGIVCRVRHSYLQPEPGFAGREIERETLNTIIHSRLREAFELLKRRLEASLTCAISARARS